MCCISLLVAMNHEVFPTTVQLNVDENVLQAKGLSYS